VSVQPRSRWSLGALVLLLALARPSLARAETPAEQAEALAARAVTMARAGDLAAAAELFEAAYTLDPAPILLYNVGRVKARQGDLAGARSALARYLELEPNPTARARGQEALAEVDARLAAASPEVVPAPVVTVLKKPEAPAPDLAPPNPPSPSLIDTTKPPVPAPDRTWTWVWIGTGAAALVAGGITAAVLLTRSGDPSSPDGVLTLGKPLGVAR
jgi:tetratricopeptide (TPR) repeat protein